ncbi:MAG: hypothetical protein methR_P0400 [Methyloprofundus sp.]|nr:MAG: hypothetical protein methR_P0400 [Methyloprofundus sp.]
MGAGGKMKKYHILCLALCVEASTVNAASFNAFDNNLSGFNSAISGQITNILGFEALSNNDSLTNQFAASNNVTFSAENGDTPFLTIRTDLFGSTPKGNLGVRVPFDNNEFSQFTSIFTEGVNSVGAYFMDNSSPISVDLFDVGNNLLSNFTISSTSESGDSGEWWGVVSDESIIARAVFTATSTSDGYGFDNFTFSAMPVSVPAPTAIWLIASGLVGFAGMRKKVPTA